MSSAEIVLLSLLLWLRTALGLRLPGRRLALPAGTEELEILHEYAVLRPLLSVLTFPSVQLKPTLDQYGPTLGHVLVKGLGLFSETLAVDEAGIFPLLAVGPAPAMIYRQPELAYRRLAGKIRQLRIARKIAHEDDLIVVSHDCLAFQ